MARTAARKKPAKRTRKPRALAPKTKKPEPGSERGSFGLMMQRQAGVRVNEDTALTLGAVFACVKVISEDIAGLPWHVHEKRGNGGSDEAPQDPADWLLHTEANPEAPAFQWRECMIAWALTWGNGYAEIERDGAGRPVWLWQITPNRVTPFREDGQIWYEVNNPTGAPTYLPANDVFHLRGPGFDGLKGYSVIQLAARSIGAGIALDSATTDLFANDSTPGGILEIPTRLSDGARKNLRESWEAMHRGPNNRRKVAILEENLKWHQTGLPPDDTKLIEQRQFTPADICFTPGCPIITGTGVKQIELIKPGELVLTHKGRWRPVKKVMMRQYFGDVVTIQAKGWESITATRNHPFYVQEVQPTRTNSLEAVGDPIWRDAGELVPVPSKVNGNRPSGTYTNLCMPRVVASDDMRLDLASLVGTGFVVDDDYITPAVHNGTAIPRRPTLDYRLGWLVGLFVGDGSTNDHQILFYLGAHETETVQMLRRYVFDVFGVECSVNTTTQERVARVLASSRVLANFFAGFGRTAREKKLPVWCMDGPSDFRRGLLAGLVASDGGSYKNDTYLRTSSRDLAWQVRLLLWSDGLNSGLETSPPSTTIIEGRTVNGGECYTVRWRKNPGSRGSLGVSESHVYAPLNRCERCQYIGPVYNLEVEEDETYTTTGGVVHNCRWFRVSPVKIQDLLRATFSNIEELAIWHVTDTLLPWCRRLETEANIKLFGRTNRGKRFTKINLNALLRGNVAARGTFYTTMLDRGVFSINDVLTLEDRNPIGSDGEKRFVQQNMQPLEKAGEVPPPGAVPPPTPNGNDKPPSDDGDEQEENDIPKNGQLRAALRPVFEDACRRLLRTEAERAKGQIKGGREKASMWFEKIRDDHAGYVCGHLRPCVSALALARGATPEKIDAALGELAGQHVEGFRNRLTAAFEMVTIPPCSNWESLAGEMAIELIDKLSNAVEIAK